MNTPAGRLPQGETWFGHPKGLFTLFMTEMWERFSYYGIRALLILFMSAPLANGGLGLTEQSAGAVIGIFLGAVYLFALWGGWAADRLIGQQNAVFYGGILIAAGNFAIAVPSMPVFYIGLALIVIGTGLLKPNVSAVVGGLYQDDTKGARRDAGFSIFYMGINLGAFIAPLIVAPVADYFGYRAGFFLAGVAITLGTLQFRVTRKLLGEAGLHAHPSTAAVQKRNWLLFWGGLGALAVLGLLAMFKVFTFNAGQLANALGTVTVGLAVYFFSYVLIFGGLDSVQKKRVGVIAVFFVAVALFFAGFEQASSTFNLFARDYTDRSFLGSWFASGEHPAGLYQAVNPVLIIVLAPVFAWIWVFLAKRNLEPSAPAKFSLGLIQLGLGFAVMAFAANLAIQQEVAPTWLLLTYLLHTTGELCLSPIGLSNVTKLAPKQYGSQMMGTWFMGISLGNLIAGVLGGHVGGGDIADMPAQFWQMTWIGVGSGALLLVLTPFIKKMMGGVR